MNEQNIIIKEILSDSDFNCRGAITPNSVAGLMKDIQKDGLLSPIILKPLEHLKYKYKVVAGHRRLLACRLLKHETIRAFVYENLSEQDARRINLVENIARQELDILQEAKSLESFLLEGHTTLTLAPELNVSTTWVEVRIRLLKLEPELQMQAKAGLLSQKQIMDLSKMSKPKRIEAARLIKELRLRGEKVGDLIEHRRKIQPTAIGRRRDGAEVTVMIDHILSVYGECLATRLGAWVNGNISDMDLFRDIKKHCWNKNLPYKIPDAYVNYADLLNEVTDEESNSDNN